LNLTKSINESVYISTLANIIVSQFNTNIQKTDIKQLSS